MLAGAWDLGAIVPDHHMPPALIWHALVDLCAHAVTCQIEPVVYKQYPGKVIKGDILVLSAGTLSYGGSHPDNATLTAPAACADACGRLPECNVSGSMRLPRTCEAGQQRKCVHRDACFRMILTPRSILVSHHPSRPSHAGMDVLQQRVRLWQGLLCFCDGQS